MDKKYKKGDKVCADCSKKLDNKRASLPWFSEQLRAKTDWIEKLLQENKRLRSEIESFSDTCKKCGCTEFLCGHNRRE